MVEIMRGKKDVEVGVVGLQGQLHQKERQMDNDGRHEDEAHGYRPWRRCDGRGVLHNCLSKEIVGYCLRVQR